MSINLNGVRFEGKYDFTITNTLTGEVREHKDVFNKITPGAYYAMVSGKDDNEREVPSNFFNLKDCWLITSDITEETSFPFISNYTAAELYGNIDRIPNNIKHSPTASYINSDDECYLQMVYEWTFERGIAFEFKAVACGCAENRGSIGYYESNPDKPWYYIGHRKGKKTSITLCNYAYYFFSKAPIKDENGNVTTLKLDEIDELKVTYTLRKHLPKFAAPKEFKVKISDKIHTIKARPAVNFYNKNDLANNLRNYTYIFINFFNTSYATNLYNYNEKKQSMGVNYREHRYRNGDFEDFGKYLSSNNSRVSYDSVKCLTDPKNKKELVVQYTDFFDVNNLNGEIGYIFVSGMGAGWELEITPKIEKNNEVTLSFSYDFKLDNPYAT